MERGQYDLAVGETTAMNASRCLECIQVPENIQFTEQTVQSEVELV